MKLVHKKQGVSEMIWLPVETIVLQGTGKIINHNLCPIPTIHTPFPQEVGRTSLQAFLQSMPKGTVFFFFQRSILAGGGE